MMTRLIVFLILFVLPSIAQNSARDVENIAAFSRLYGYVRYFHPSDEAALVDWNTFIVQGIKKVRLAGNAKELQTVLEGIFLPIAPTLRIGPSDFVFSDSIHESTDIGSITAWQHRGIQLGFPPYLSSRINRIDSANSALLHYISRSGASHSTSNLDLKSLFFKLSIHAKSSNSGGQLRLRAWNKNYVAALNKSVLIDSSSNWKEYVLEGHCDSSTWSVMFEITPNQVTELGIDDVSFELIDSQQAKETLLKEDFENGRSALRISGSLFHASLPTRSSFNGSRSLLLQKKNYQMGQLFDQFPRYGEAISKPISNELSCHVPLALSSKQSEVDYGFHRQESLQMDNHNISVLDESVRMANVIIAWNLIQHFYPYRDAFTGDWEKILLEILNRTRDDKTSFDFYVTFAKMMSGIRDGHCRVKYKPEYKVGYFPFIAELIEDNLVIVHSDDTSLFRPGDKVLAINDESIDAVLRAKRSIISGSQQWQDFVLTHRYDERSFDGGPLNSSAVIVIQRGNDTLIVHCKRNTEDVRKARTIRIPTRQSIEHIGEGIYYVDICQISYTSFMDNFETLNNAHGVIFDCRGYPSDDVWDILAHLTDAPMSTEKLYIPEIIYPDYEGPIGIDSSTMWTINQRYPRLKTKVVFLQDKGCISAAELLLAFVRHYKLGHLVGETSAGANGNWNVVDLLGGFNLSFTGMKVLQQDGSPHHVLGIRPDVVVSRTLEGVSAERDEILEAAFKILNRKTLK